MSRPLRFSGDAAFISHRRTGLRLDEKCYTAFVTISPDRHWRFAAVSSKRVGGAVERNRAKRRLRAAFNHAPRDHSPLSVIFYTKAAILRAAFPDLVESVEKTLPHALNSHRTS